MLAHEGSRVFSRRRRKGGGSRRYQAGRNACRTFIHRTFRKYKFGITRKSSVRAISAQLALPSPLLPLAIAAISLACSTRHLARNVHRKSLTARGSARYAAANPIAPGTNDVSPSRFPGSARSKRGRGTGGRCDRAGRVGLEAWEKRSGVYSRTDRICGRGGQARAACTREPETVF